VKNRRPHPAIISHRNAHEEDAGLSIDLGNEICRRLRIRCVWVETAFDRIIPALQGRKFNAMLSAMSVTPKRETQVAFSSMTAMPLSYRRRRAQ
jgi:ABC-type amino acid transport substrate-binding protein